MLVSLLRRRRRGSVGAAHHLPAASHLQVVPLVKDCVIFFLQVARSPVLFAAQRRALRQRRLVSRYFDITPEWVTSRDVTISVSDLFRRADVMRDVITRRLLMTFMTRRYT